MPHYKDGSEAKVGDIIKGEGYNLPGVCVGTLIQITPGHDACNLIILVLRINLLEDAQDKHSFIHKLRTAHDVFTRPKEGIVHTDGRPREYETVLLEAVREYGALKDFELVFRPGEREAKSSR